MVGKGGVSPLVLVAGVTGHRQEAAHRELRLRLCGMMTEGRRQVMPRASGQNVHVRKSCSLNGTLSANKRWCAPVPLHPPPPGSQAPPEDCVPMRGHTAASFPSVVFALHSLRATPPLPRAVFVCTGTTVHTKEQTNGV